MGRKDEKLNRWLQGRLNCTSPDNQNELIHIMGRMILRKIVSGITHYAILVDESPDYSNKEQAVFCLRYVRMCFFFHISHG